MTEICTHKKSLQCLCVSKSFDISWKSNLTLNLQFISISIYIKYIHVVASHGAILIPCFPSCSHAVTSYCFPHSLWSFAQQKLLFIYFVSNIVRSNIFIYSHMCLWYANVIQSRATTTSIRKKKLFYSNRMWMYVEHIFVLFFNTISFKSSLSFCCG